MPFILHNVAGHKAPNPIRWLSACGGVSLKTPLGASWLRVTESLERRDAARPNTICFGG
jgi:hypothetical protein